MTAALIGLVDIKVDDPVAFTFFTGYMAMLAASIFFFAERGSVEGKWKLSLLGGQLLELDALLMLPAPHPQALYLTLCRCKALTSVLI